MATTKTVSGGAPLISNPLGDLYTENCTFFEVDERVVGRDALNAKVEAVLREAPGFVHGRLQWHFGPSGAAPVVTGMDVAVFEQGKIRALYTFLDQVR